MTRHQLEGRKEEELLWFQRRDAIKAAGLWLAMGGLPAAIAQDRSNIVELYGDALINGSRLLPGQTIQTGDQLQTGPGAGVVFALGNASFRVRQNTLMTVERGPSLLAVSLLRLITGGVVSVWNKGGSRSIITPTLTAGIRGTGVYTEVQPERDNRTYFCNCYGTVELVADSTKVESQSDYHQSFWAETSPTAETVIRSAGFLNHTDEELEFLAALIGQRTYWQTAGRKGRPDGKGTMGY